MTNKQNQWEVLNKFVLKVNKDGWLFSPDIWKYLKENFTHKQTLIDEVKKMDFDNQNYELEVCIKKIKKEIIKLIKK